MQNLYYLSSQELEHMSRVLLEGTEEERRCLADEMNSVVTTRQQISEKLSERHNNKKKDGVDHKQKYYSEY